MSEQDARDPYLGLNAHIREQARGQLPERYVLGRVLSVSPLAVRAAGLDLDREDLLVAQHLLPGWREQLDGLRWPLTVRLPEKTLTGTCEITVDGTGYTGRVSVTRPGENVKGETAETAGCIHAPLEAGDTVILIPDQDGQTYFLIEKLVKA